MAAISSAPPARGAARGGAVERLTQAFYLLLACAFLGGSSLLWSETARRGFVESFHLTSPRFSSWAARQFIPNMYNFANQAWWAERPLSDAALDGEAPLPDGSLEAWLNHYPVRMLTFGTLRAAASEREGVSHLYLRSRFRGAQLDTHYRLVPGEAGLSLVVQRSEWSDARP